MKSSQEAIIVNASVKITNHKKIEAKLSTNVFFNIWKKKKYPHKKTILYLLVCSEFRRIQAYSHSDRSSTHTQGHRHHRSYKEHFHMETGKRPRTFYKQYNFYWQKYVSITKYVRRAYPRTEMTECGICKELSSSSVLVSDQQLTKIKTVGVRILCHVKRIAPRFTNTKESAEKLTFYHGRCKFFFPKVIERVALKVTERKVACWISIESTVLHGKHQVKQRREKY